MISKSIRRSAWRRIALALALCAGFAPVRPAQAQSPAGHPDWPGKGQLFVGTCYQPIDRSPAQIQHDIAIMKKAGFTMVRMGDLSWDSFEPREGPVHLRLVRRRSWRRCTPRGSR